jgi:hypothetical protein
VQTPAATALPAPPSSAAAIMVACARLRQVMKFPSTEAELAANQWSMAAHFRFIAPPDELRRWPSRRETPRQINILRKKRW